MSTVPRLGAQGMEQQVPRPAPKQNRKGPRGPIWQQRNMVAQREKEKGGVAHRSPQVPREEGGGSKALTQGPRCSWSSCSLLPPLLPGQAGGGDALFSVVLRWPRLLGFLKEESTNEGCRCGQGQVLAPGRLTSCQAVAA